MKISKNKYVTLTYDLHVGEGEKREQVEQATIENHWNLFLASMRCLKHLKVISRD